MKHGGGSIMIWGAISTKGALTKAHRTPLKLIEGKKDMKVILCQTRSSLSLKRLILGVLGFQILIRHVLPVGKRLLRRGFTFQEDNDHKPCI